MSREINKAYAVPVTVILLEPANEDRKTVTLQNQHPTASFWVAGSGMLRDVAMLKIAPGAALLRDILPPTGEIYARSDIAGAELTIVQGF